VSGFCAESGAAAMIIGASFAGIPVSTTHTITGSILGVGTVTNIAAVHWGVTKNIMGAWILTIPTTAIVSALFYYAITLIF